MQNIITDLDVTSRVIQALEAREENSENFDIVAIAKETYTFDSTHRTYVPTADSEEFWEIAQSHRTTENTPKKETPMKASTAYFTAQVESATEYIRSLNDHDALTLHFGEHHLERLHESQVIRNIHTEVTRYNAEPEIKEKNLVAWANRWQEHVLENFQRMHNSTDALRSALTMSEWETKTRLAREILRLAKN